MKREEFDICAEVRAHIARRYKTQSEAARNWGCSSAYVSKVLKGEKAMPEHMSNEAGFVMVKKWVRVRK